MEMHCL